MCDELCKKLQECKECRYYDWEVNVWDESSGYGKYGCHIYSDKAKIMIVGQNPSHIRFHSPLNHSLSGSQGDLFRDIFGKDNLMLTNLVKISTPDNKITAEDAIHGYYHLKEEIDFYKPELIITLGKFCNDYILNADNIVKLKHPDYFMKYRVSGLEMYIEELNNIKKRMLLTS